MTHPSVDPYLAKAKQWREEMTKLREIAAASGLTEDFKWGHPCYALDGHNVVLIHGFKDYCALLFMKGALMADPEAILVQQTENVQSSRQIRFTGLQQITEMEPVLKAYIHNAAAVEKAGLSVEKKKTEDYPVPEELIRRFEEDPDYHVAFEALTPGRQRGYLLHFSGAKQSATREARIEKYREKILAGKGHMD
jgi:uncharacterized protein YdeI (YjbR/CyaY-like superfamily)